LIQGQATANLAEYTFTNGTANPVKVTSLSLTRTGVSADSTLANLYLFDGAVRLTDAVTLSSGVATYNNTNGIFTIPANSTKTISVKSDIAKDTSGQTVGVSLSAITADGTLSSVLPVAASIHSIANATLATVSLSAALPTNSSSTSTASDPINDVRVWESTFSVNNRNVQFTKLALRQINSIDSKDVQNFRLLIDGVVVSTVASLDANGYVTFTFDKTLTTGSKNVKVLADITGGSSRAIQMSLRNKADIDVKDADYGVNISVTGAPNTADDIVVNSGAFSITANNAVLPITVANNASNVLIGKWTFKATGEAVKVETLKAGFTYTETGTANNASASLRNGKIMINGAQAGSTASSTASLLQAGTEYSVNYTFQPGVETVVELYADIYDDDTTQAGGLASGDTILAKLVAGSANGTKQVSLATMNVPDTVDSTASTITVSSGSTTLTATTSYGNQSVVVPQQTPFKIGSWTMTAGTAEDINVSGLSFAIASNGGTTFTVADMYEMYATYQVGSGAVISTNVTTSPTTPAAYSTSFTLPKGQSVKIELYSKLLGGNVTDNDGVQATLTVSGTGAQSGADADSSATGGQVITAKAGRLNVSKDASSPIAALATGSTSSVKVASYKFEAQNDAYTVSQLNFTLTGTSAITNVYVKDGSTVIASVAPAATVEVNLSTPITIPANSSKIISVEVDLGAIGTGAGSTGSNVSVQLNSYIERPASTGTATTTTLGTPLLSATQYVYKSIPTVSLVSLPDTRLTIGTKTVQKFTVSADAKSSIAWNQIKFTLARSAATTIPGLTNTSTGTEHNADGTFIALYDGTTLIPGTMASTADFDGTTATSTVLTFVPTSEQQIAAGTTKTYELKVLVSGDTTSGKYLMSGIASDGSHASSAAASTLTANNLVWSDMSAQSHATTTGDWTNGNLVKTLPTDTQSLTGAN